METGGAWVDFTLTRGPIRGKNRNTIGLILRVQARRDVEDFMSGLAQGRRMQVEAVADSWYNTATSADPLEFYDADTHSNDVRPYTLDNIGGALLINPNEGRAARLAVPAQPQELVNLSFLKLVGISNDSGVAVGLSGAYSGDYIRRVKAAFPAAIKQFLQDYLVPMTISLQVVSRG